ncbi:hypothetical protein AGMMS49525_05280 [Bacteroidia bacterium]|nr:hypothetical protein AGMMS49525_05280 [Bacteroidia bacterium]
MKLCIQCKKENPSSANHCMYCGAALVEEEQLPEEVKLQKKLTEQEEENKLLKAALEAQLKKETEKPKENVVEKPIVVTPPPIARPAVTPSPIAKPTMPPRPKSNKKLIGLIVALSAVAFVVFGSFLFFAVIRPAIIDKNAPRYYTFADNVFLRSSQEAGVDYNKIATLSYGSELITYEHYFDWSKVKDKSGNKGYISSDYLLDYFDFSILNGIWGDMESKQCINTAKCRLALLNYLKVNALGNEWQVFCRPKNTKPNAVFFPRLYNKNSKFTDFAVIFKNTQTGERKIVIFGFNDDETVAWTKSNDAPNSGYIKNIALNYYGEIYVDYSE